MTAVCDITFEVKIDNQNLNIDDPKPTGRQLLKAAGKAPVKEYALIQLLDDGGMEEIGLDETVDLCETGKEKFITFKTDRLFRFELNDQMLFWGAIFITGRKAKKLADVDPEKYALWLLVEGGEDRLIGDRDRVNLSEEGLERLYTTKIFLLDIEGTIHPWYRPTISVEEIARLGGWPIDQGVIEVNDKDQTERTLQPGEIIHLKPGHSYGKRHRWKRGFDIPQRIQAELTLLRHKFPEVVHKPGNDGHWFLIKGFLAPPPWKPEETAVCFFITNGHPGAPPYGFFVLTELTHNGQPPSVANAQHQPPFEGAWRFLSWSPENWRTGADVQTGENLWGSVGSFRSRLQEGV